MEGDMITTGTPLVAPPLVDMISNDPILGDVKVAVIFYTYVLSPAITEDSNPFYGFGYVYTCYVANHSYLLLDAFG